MSEMQEKMEHRLERNSFMNYTHQILELVEKVEQVLHDVIASHAKTLNHPAEPFARVSKYGSSAIEYTVRVWCANGDYWDVYFDVTKAVKAAFDANGIEMTYDHLNVHIVENRG